jgi:hypothetical protein
MELRRIEKIVVVFNTMVEIPFNNREELVWYATPVAHDRNLEPTVFGIMMASRITKVVISNMVE